MEVYTDDFTVTAIDKDILKNIKKILIGFLEEKGLSLSEKKTEITHIDI